MSAPSRRQFLATVACGAAACVVAAVAHRAPAQSGDLPLLSESDPTAKALGYVDDVAKVPAGEPLLKPDARCANCLHYQGRPEAATAPCALFPGKAVPGKAWCKAWAAKPA